MGFTSELAHLRGEHKPELTKIKHWGQVFRLVEEQGLFVQLAALHFSYEILDSGREIRFMLDDQPWRVNYQSPFCNLF